MHTCVQDSPSTCRGRTFKYKAFGSTFSAGESNPIPGPRLPTVSASELSADGQCNSADDKVKICVHTYYTYINWRVYTCYVGSAPALCNPVCVCVCVCVHVLFMCVRACLYLPVIVLAGLHIS
jgi:hypothetical protein